MEPSPCESFYKTLTGCPYIVLNWFYKSFVLLRCCNSVSVILKDNFWHKLACNRSRRRSIFWMSAEHPRQCGMGLIRSACSQSLLDNTAMESRYWLAVDPGDAVGSTSPSATMASVWAVRTSCVVISTRSEAKANHEQTPLSPIVRRVRTIYHSSALHSAQVTITNW